MLHYVRNIITVVLAFFIFSVGNGVNLVEYCCNQCENQGVEVLLDDHCNQLHHGHEHEISCCADVPEGSIICGEHKCQLTRYSLDEGNELTSNKVISPYVTQATLIRTMSANVVQQSASYINIYSSSGFVQYSGRNILNRICILII